MNFGLENVAALYLELTTGVCIFNPYHCFFFNFLHFSFYIFFGFYYLRIVCNLLGIFCCFIYFSVSVSVLR